MAMDVIFTTTEQGWFRWAGQYVKRQPTGRRTVSIPPGTTAKATRDALINALNTAGAGGRLVISVGHGTFIAGQPADGLCELSPGGKLVLVGRNIQPHNPPPGATIVNVFYDVPAFSGQPSDLDHDTKNNPNSQRLKDWALYQDIAKAVRRTRPFRIVLLTCRVGSATEFLRKIANDWDVVIGAYTRRVACTEDTYSQPGQRSVTTSYVHLEGEVYPKSSSSGGDDNAIASEELPYRPSQSVWIGPPLPRP
jgi:hypothetical protein